MKLLQYFSSITLLIAALVAVPSAQAIHDIEHFGHDHGPVAQDDCVQWHLFGVLGLSKLDLSLVTTSKFSELVDSQYTSFNDFNASQPFSIRAPPKLLVN